MMELEVAFLKPHAVLPAYALEGDAGLDLVAVESASIRPGERKAVGTGIAIAIPEGTVGLVVPRSGLAMQHGIVILNSPGVIDSGYRGEIFVLLFNVGLDVHTVAVGDRIAQLLVHGVERVRPLLVEKLPESARGAGGFGHTGT